MRSILILNAKGGSGKTTIATNLAGYYANKGKKVVLADFDPQGSSIDWLRQRRNNFPKILGLEAFVKPPRPPKETEILIMDAPSRTHDDQLVSLLKKAQTAIVPVVPSPMDIRAAQRFFGELKSLRASVQNDVRIATIASRARENSQETRNLEDLLYDFRLPSGRRFPFLTLLRQSANYIRAAQKGLSIFEFAPLTTALDREYWKPLIQWLAHRRSKPN
ncbi:MAG: AAA family ATPase [Pseudomonadota bacterium]|nr:AAA family ATPase [Pseudomonadota bacterium]